MSDNYTDIRSKLSSSLPFHGNSCSAHTGVCPDCHKAENYIVMSYSTVVYEHCYECHHKVLNVQYYSVTTSKLQGYIAAIDSEYSDALQADRKARAK